MKCKHCDGRGAVQIAPNVKGLKRCPVCGGSGKYMREVGGYRPCEYCNGTGKIVQTNEEWFCQLSTEEKAKFLKKISFCCNTCSPEQFKAYKNGKFECPLKMACATANGFEDWLKEKHE